MTVAIQLSCCNVFAQPDSLWSRTYGGSGSEYCYSLVQTTDGGFSLAGNTWSEDSTGFWLVKTDENGDNEWSHRYENTYYFFSHIQTTDEGYALVGAYPKLEPSDCDFLLLRTDSNGDSLWTRTFGGTEADCCKVVIETMDGGFALAGQTWSFGPPGSQNGWLVRTDANGDSLWSCAFGDSGAVASEFNSLIQTEDGGFALGGPFSSWTEYRLIRTNEWGELLWSLSFGRDHWGCGFIPTEDGGFLVAGKAPSQDERIYDYWLIKIDQVGDSLWLRTFEKEGHGRWRSLIETFDGGFALAGFTSEPGDQYDFWLMRTAVNGDSLWSVVFGGMNSDDCYSIIQTADSGFALGGYTESFGAGSSDFWLVKTGPDPVSVPRLADPAYPQQFILLPPYPNPFNGRVNIGFEIARPGQICLDVFDLSGRRVTEIQRGAFDAGQNFISWDASGLPSGQYIIRLSDDRPVGISQQVMLIK